ncbi:uncharacterized protein LOC116291725 [Actinia tenebrosa]|uniref:Uncharacterized protein LOC116291725 n=1 Tax=Actinia tenebrosa TaxID=6105 RepID=A0A6P8HEE0_ACTTE|nr:uncharacterized protein LOC116291725 [Actinia tenebrosa]
MAAAARRNFDDVITVLLFDDSSDNSSSDDDDLDLLLVEFLFPPQTNKDVPRLNFQDITDADCETMFRFQKNDMEHLLDCLQIPEHFVCSQRTKATGMEALMILLRRLAYPNRWCDLVPIFGRPESELSLIFNKVLDDIYDRFKHLLESLDLIWLDPQLFSQVIYDKGAPLEQCWGFIDGTPRPIARPTANQRIMYSGHKRTHCLKFQSVQAPNGLIAHMYGPIEGRRHDAFMLGESGLLNKLQRFQKPSGEPYVIYGDPAYGITQNIISPFRGARLPPDQQQFNSLMSKVRVTVEWGFGKITQLFAFLDFKRNLKVLLQPTAKYYLVACVLVNCHTCLYGSQTSKFFGLDPPTLERYLSNQ